MKAIKTSLPHMGWKTHQWRAGSAGLPDGFSENTVVLSPHQGSIKRGYSALWLLAALPFFVASVAMTPESGGMPPAASALFAAALVVAGVLTMGLWYARWWPLPGVVCVDGDRIAMTTDQKTWSVASASRITGVAVGHAQSSPRSTSHIRKDAPLYGVALYERLTPDAEPVAGCVMNYETARLFFSVLRPDIQVVPLVREFADTQRDPMYMMLCVISAALSRDPRASRPLTSRADCNEALEDFRSQSYVPALHLVDPAPFLSR